MRRFFIGPEDITGCEAIVTGEEAGHMTRTLRMRPGERVLLNDGQGREYTAQITAVGANRVNLNIESEQPASGEPPVEVILVQGLPKGNKMESVIQKGTEVGVKKFIPVAAKRSVVQFTGPKAQRRCQRWQRVAREAAKQCGRGLVPQVYAPQELSAALEMIATCAFTVVFWEGEKKTGLKQVLASPVDRNSVGIVIGPEGGWTEEEVKEMKNKGVVPVSLGPRILRTETAGIVAAALFIYELGDLGGPVNAR